MHCHSKRNKKGWINYFSRLRSISHSCLFDLYQWECGTTNAVCGTNSDHFARGGPLNCIGKTNPSGWINEKLFIEYLDHFASHTQCSKENMVLLILDNHKSHISLVAVDKCRELGIVLLTISPHTSHHLQPLDKCIWPL